MTQPRPAAAKQKHKQKARSDLNGADTCVPLVESDVHAEHVLGRIEGELDVAFALAQARAARPARLEVSTAVAS